MGYRSDVAYAIQFKDADERATFRDVMLHKNDQHITQALEETEDFRNGYKDKYIVFKINNVKWYDSYPDVKAHRQLMEQACELFEASYRFIAIGEDGAETYNEDGDAHDDLSDMIQSVHELRTAF
jgi:predicted nuclease of restriction endonuclease-like RecB superfamily